MSYGDVVEILEDDAIAMRVDVSADSPPARPYWRMVVLDAYHQACARRDASALVLSTDRITIRS